ncbi:hypothetical protein TNCV_1172211 [Trichonephila clavipes]|uniref:Uncharacterized protein n=1 Tax=Trichonephila clavipes TaxID=2585209 RepID=A0A8X6S794_TRICX|nr:hypothetical protein TNCV_1172211 [Trichonephila clavipes]
MNTFLSDGLDELQTTLTRTLSRSPYLTLCAFFWRGYVKDMVFFSPFPVDLTVLKQHITTAIDGLDLVTLTRIWVEMDYRFIVCRVTKD